MVVEMRKPTTAPRKPTSVIAMWADSTTMTTYRNVTDWDMDERGMIWLWVGENRNKADPDYILNASMSSFIGFSDTLPDIQTLGEDNGDEDTCEQTNATKVPLQV